MWTPSAKLAAVQVALILLGTAAVAALVVSAGHTGAIAGDGYQGPYGFGTPATAAEIAAMDTDIAPDAHHALVGQVLRGEGDLSLVIHGLQGVVQQVQEHPLQLLPVQRRGRNRGIEGAHELHL